IKMGRPGPVMVEIPADVAVAEVGDLALAYKAVKTTQPAGNPRDIEAAARALVQAKRPVIHAGQGVLYAEASAELIELAELLHAPVLTKLASDEVPITPYRVIWDFMHAIDPRDAIVTHDSGSPRNQLVPFYSATAPRGYMGWGKSHALGTGLGLIMGAKLAAPDKFCVN